MGEWAPAPAYFEVAPRFGPSQGTGPARIGGHAVGVLANDPLYYAGAVTAPAAEKLTRMVDLCDSSTCRSSAWSISPAS